MNLIDQEVKDSKKYMFEDEEINGLKLVKLNHRNVALVEAIIRNDSKYINSSNIHANINVTKYGSLGYWLTQLKEILIFKIKLSSDGYDYKHVLEQSINAIDRENSTHLNGDKIGREEILNRLLKLDKNKLIDMLKNPKDNNYKLVDLLAKETTKGRRNYSFATKFCHYACYYLFEGKKEQDNFSIFDAILKNNIPNYCKKYNIQISKKDLEKNDYNIYINVIDNIRKAAKKEYGEEISRNGLDHLIWYYHKGR